MVEIIQGMGFGSGSDLFQDGSSGNSNGESYITSVFHGRKINGYLLETLSDGRGGQGRADFECQ